MLTQTEPRERSRLDHLLEQLNVHDHLCLIYENQREQLAAILPFIRIGLERGEKCLYAVDESNVDYVLVALRAAGIRADEAHHFGALAFLNKRESYLRQGVFNPDEMIDLLRQAIDEAKSEGYTALRVTGEMTWALGTDPGVERLIEYEAKLNYFLPEHDILAICQYNRRRFPPEILREVILTHPFVIAGSTVCRNFYYIPPEEYLCPNQAYAEVDRLLDHIVMREHYEEVLLESRNVLARANQALQREIEERKRVEGTLRTAKKKWRTMALTHRKPLNTRP